MAEETYTLEEIKAAFWKAFHKSGELWFDYLERPEDPMPDEEHWNGATNGYWEDLRDALRGEE